MKSSNLCDQNYTVIQILPAVASKLVTNSLQDENLERGDYALQYDKNLSLTHVFEIFLISTTEC